MSPDEWDKHIAEVRNETSIDSIPDIEVNQTAWT